MKVIEKMDGPEGFQKFLASLPDKNGFGYSQGYSVKISRGDDGEPVATVTYNGDEWELKPELIKEIIGERDALNEEIAQRKLNEE